MLWESPQRAHNVEWRQSDSYVTHDVSLTLLHHVTAGSYMKPITCTDFDFKNASCICLNHPAHIYVQYATTLKWMDILSGELKLYHFQICFVLKVGQHLKRGKIFPFRVDLILARLSRPRVIKQAECHEHCSLPFLWIRPKKEVYLHTFCCYFCLGNYFSQEILSEWRCLTWRPLSLPIKLFLTCPLLRICYQNDVVSRRGVYRPTLLYLKNFPHLDWVWRSRK